MKTLGFATLLASTVHDVKNLLGSAMEGVDWLQSSPKKMDPEQRLELHNINGTLGQINHDLTQLLFLYKLENQQYRLNLRQGRVLEFVEIQMAYLDSMRRDPNLEVLIEVDEDLFAYFDEMLLGIALRNAFINALRYARTKILVKAYHEANFLVLNIIDDGAGYPSPMLDLKGVSPQLCEKKPSTGLGLYFCQQVVNLHRSKHQLGKLELCNNDSQAGLTGASLTISIPQPKNS